MANAQGYLYEGDLYMARIVGGVEQPMQGPFEGSRLALQMNVERIDMISRGKNKTGQVLESVPIPQPGTLALTLNSGDPAVVAIGLMGSVATLTQASGAWADEAFVVAALDTWLPLAKASLGTSIVVKDVTGVTTYVEGTHYQLNRDLGWIKVPTGSPIAAAATIELTGPYNAISGKKVKGGTTPDLRIKLVMDGRNMADGAKCKVQVWEAILATEEAVDFLSGQFLGTPLTGSMKTPTGKDSPFEVDFHDAAA